jgi:hypothetical protein
MSQDTFLVCIKSAVDKLCNQMAVDLGIKFLDTDDTTQTSKIFNSSDNALLFEFGTLQPDPQDPIYVGHFNVGARTVTDPGNYEILKLVGLVSGIFPKGERILIHDSYLPVETGLIGVLVPGDVEVISQQYDILAGVRMVHVTFRAQRLLAVVVPSYTLNAGSLTQGQLLEGIDLALPGALTLVVNSMAQAQSQEAVGVTQGSTLTLNPIAQAQSLETASLTQSSTLVMGSMVQGQVLTNEVLDLFLLDSTGDPLLDSLGSPLMSTG